MRQYFIIFFSILAVVAVVLVGAAIKGYHDVVPPSDVYSDWTASPHVIVDWPGIILLIGGVAGFSFIVWIVLRKRKQKSN